MWLLLLLLMMNDDAIVCIKKRDAQLSSLLFHINFTSNTISISNSQCYCILISKLPILILQQATEQPHCLPEKIPTFYKAYFLKTCYFPKHNSLYVYCFYKHNYNVLLYAWTTQTAPMPIYGLRFLQYQNLLKQ